MSYVPTYDPDNDARPAGKRFTRQLSQRDLSLAVPVNFVEHAGISLTAACFAHNRYVAQAAQRCLSNLLAIGFHRYEVDVYWDGSRQVWSLCPVEMGGGEGTLGETTTTVFAEASSTGTAGQGTDLSMMSMSAPALVERDVGRAVRRQATATNSVLAADTLTQASSVPTTLDVDETSITASSSSTAATDGPSPEADGAGSYRQMGPYACSESVDLDWLSRIMWTFLDRTETNLNATLRYVLLNLHAAASASDPTAGGEAPSSANLPGSEYSLGAVMTSNLSSFLYTPANLRQQRADINASWYDVPQDMLPVSGYYNVRGARDMMSTPDGWPSESFVEMSEGKRLFVGLGTIDPQMEGYDVTQDNDVVFPRNFLSDFDPLTIDATGRVTSGCFYTPGEYSVSIMNNSWAFADAPDLAPPSVFTVSSNITRCGISPLLNTTLQNVTADQNFLPYQTYFHSTIWSWAPDYPRAANASRPLSTSDNNDDRDLGSQARCAALNASSGFWQNVVCDSTHYSACRDRGSVYDWSISADDASYTKAGISCRDGADFDVPRTGLQNTYLLNTWRGFRRGAPTDSDARIDDLLWLNFNNLDSELCWVVGQNSTCPYVNRRSGDRRVIVPVVAAVVVFALGVLTVFVKCAANRRMNKRQKRRRRGDDGWDYEGVPS